VLEVPAPLEEWSVLESAVQLFHQLNASSLAIAGGSRFANQDGSADVLANAFTPFAVFHHVFARRNVLQIRGYTEATQARLPSFAAEDALYVKAELPRSLSLQQLRQHLGDFRVIWKPAPLDNAQARRTRTGFAELWLSRRSRIALKSALAMDQSKVARLKFTVEEGGAATLDWIEEDSLMLEWLMAQRHQIAKAGSDQYLPATREDMQYFDEEILTPLLEAARTGYRLGELTPAGRRLVQAIAGSCALFDYQVSFKHDASLGQDFLVLAETPRASPRRHWGTFAIRLGEARPYAIQVPRPLYDLNSLEYGVHLFAQLQAETLMLAGSHHEANRDQTSDELDVRNPVNLFSLVNQVLMRRSQDRPIMAVQCRGFARVPGLADARDALLALPDGIRDEAMLTPLGRSLVQCLTEDGLRLQFVDGSPLTAGYEISCVPQAHYVIESARKEFAILWLSQPLRQAYHYPEEGSRLEVQLETLGIPTVREDVPTWLKHRLDSGRRTRLPPALKETLDHYAATMDIVSLAKAQHIWPEFEFMGVMDRNTGTLLLTIAEDQRAAPVALNLRSRTIVAEANGQSKISSLQSEVAEGGATTLDSRRIERFLARRSSWLEWPL
jgi:hypothetical protein